MSSYDKLRPWVEIERCSCETVTRLVLVGILTDNPIHCFDCKNEVDPEVLELDENLVDEIAHWYQANRALFALWLHSGEYEQYAKERLLDRNSQVNVEGLRLTKRLSEVCIAYYWWFSDTEDGEPFQCPHCHADLDLDVKHGAGKCESCRIVV